MNKTFSILLTRSLVIMITLLLTACATPNTHTGSGFLYENHFEGDYVTANQAGRKRGEACTSNILGLVTSGDGSFSAAMRNGGITAVSSADHYYKSILGVWSRVCLVVTGN